MKMKKHLIFALIASFVAMSFLSCSKAEVNETAKETLSNTTAMVSETTATNVDTKVFAISKVGEAATGKAVDFNWTEAGKNLSFAEITKGKVVLLNFWGTWCPPCRAEIPDLLKLNKDMNGKDFIMVGIALERDQTTAMKKVQSFAENQKMDYYLFVDETRDIVNAYGGINAVPTTFIIDKAGKIAETIVGMRDYNGFLESINRVLK